MKMGAVKLIYRESAECGNAEEREQKNRWTKREKQIEKRKRKKAQRKESKTH